MPGFVGALLPPPPQLITDRDREANNNPQLSRRNRRFQRLIFPGAKARPITPAMASPPAGIHGLERSKGRSGWSMALAAAVATVSVLVTAVPPDGVTLAGENEQVAMLGTVPQENFTVPV